MPLPEELAGRVLEQLKQVLKLKEMTYGQLAEELSLSVATVKRFLNDQDISLVRLAQVCAVLEIDAAELLAGANMEPRGKSRLYTEEEEEFFVRNIHHLGYFTELARGKSPGQIAKKYGLSKRSTTLFLENLEKEGFIRVYPGHKVKVLVHATGAWRPGGPLMKANARTLVSHISKGLEQQMLNNTGERLDVHGADPLPKLAHVWYYYCRPSTRESYIREIREATVRFLTTAAREVRSDGEEALEPFLMSLFFESGEQYRDFLTAILVKDLP